MDFQHSHHAAQPQLMLSTIKFDQNYDCFPLSGFAFGSCRNTGAARGRGINLARSERNLRDAFEIPAYEAVLGSAQFHRRSTGLVGGAAISLARAGRRFSIARLRVGDHGWRGTRRRSWGRPCGHEPAAAGRAMAPAYASSVPCRNRPGTLPPVHFG